MKMFMTLQPVGKTIKTLSIDCPSTRVLLRQHLR
jgi:hypothetical protein